MAGLLDFLQQYSNEAANTVAGPVDLLALGLRAAGVPVGNAPVGGSEWLKQRGLMRDVPQSAASLAGSTAGLLTPTLAIANAAKLARGLLQAGENVAAKPSLLGPAAKQRGIFMGDLSKTWDKAAAEKAAQMEKAGADARAIWNETGTFKGPDGKWRQEISDDIAKFNPSTINGVVRENDVINGMPGMNFGTGADLLHHPPLKEAYGRDLVPNTFVGNKNTLLGDGVQGAYDEAAGAITINAPAKAADARSTMLHELQHAVQQRQGFARGGSPSNVAVNIGSLPDKTIVDAATSLAENAAKWGISVDDILAKPPRWMVKGYGNTLTQDATKYLAKTPEALKRAQDKLRESADAMLNPFETYKRLAGEAEARAVQSRMNLTPAQRRALFPLDSYDVPIDELIVRGGLLGD